MLDLSVFKRKALGSAAIMLTALSKASASSMTGFGSVQLDPSLASAQNKTISYQPTTAYQPCTCNLTSQTCDAFCCCDKDCKPVSRAGLISVLLSLWLNLLTFFVARKPWKCGLMPVNVKKTPERRLRACVCNNVCHLVKNFTSTIWSMAMSGILTPWHSYCAYSLTIVRRWETIGCRRWHLAMMRFSRYWTVMIIGLISKISMMPAWPLLLMISGLTTPWET